MVLSRHLAELRGGDDRANRRGRAPCCVATVADRPAGLPTAAGTRRAKAKPYNSMRVKRVHCVAFTVAFM
jgi:hypothetical protein